MTDAKASLPPIAVDLLRPEDAPGVADLFRLIYGEAYPVKIYYDPEALIAANREGTIISSVARTPEGRVVGHNALFNHVPHPKCHESGAGLVHPEFRVADLFSRMVAHGVQVGPQFGLEVVWAEPVCSHVYSQKLCHGQDFVTMTLEVGLMPAAAYAKETKLRWRVSNLIDFVTLVPYDRAVHLPEPYAEQLVELYAGFKDQRHFLPADRPLPAGVATRLDNRIIDFAQVARMSLHQPGADLAAVLDQAEAEAAARGVVTTQVWLNLGQACVGAAVEELRGRGYFLGGPLPGWFGHDGLLLQRLSEPVQWDTINLEYDRAKRLLALVRADYHAIQGG